MGAYDVKTTVITLCDLGLKTVDTIKTIGGSYIYN